MASLPQARSERSAGERCDAEERRDGELGERELREKQRLERTMAREKRERLTRETRETREREKRERDNAHACDAARACPSIRRHARRQTSGFRFQKQKAPGERE